MDHVSTENHAPKGAATYVALAVWAVLTVAGLGGLAAYSFSAGPQAVPPPRGRLSLSHVPGNESYELVMAVHPKCPCSRASIGELARLLAQFQEELQCTVLVYRPHQESDDWADTDLTRSAQQQPNTRVVFDKDGMYARQLGMSTSGSVILYSPDGVARYWGGITMARGHAGDNIGSDAIRAILSGSAPDRQTAPVFGCEIYEDAD